MTGTNNLHSRHSTRTPVGGGRVFFQGCVEAILNLQSALVDNRKLSFESQQACDQGCQTNSLITASSANQVNLGEGETIAIIINKIHQLVNTCCMDDNVYWFIVTMELHNETADDPPFPYCRLGPCIISRGPSSLGSPPVLE